MPSTGLPYDRYVQDALKQVMRRALEEVAENGFPGQHHFYITFRTAHPAVEVPEHLRSQYADEMTIVLQHQFFGLEVHDDRFEVTLSFNKQLERLSIPFEAITAFVDPSVSFGLQFQAEGAPAPAERPAAAAAEAGEAEAGESGEETEEAPSGPAEVVSLDAFRKNK